MPIDYSRLHDILKEQGTTLYKLNAEKVIGSATRQKLLGQIPGGIDARTIEALCERLNCQPGDFMTYIPLAQKIQDAEDRQQYQASESGKREDYERI